MNFAESDNDSFAFRKMSIDDVLSSPVSEKLKGKIVLVGGVTDKIGDMYTTPFAFYSGTGAKLTAKLR
ncbi:CHASE2 domain-containing protein [Candidatus Desantisbacteria bacterium]|nr:CHASE2 domain-containing protein [Candidatus Desantisbacteria bacterium]